MNAPRTSSAYLIAMCLLPAVGTVPLALVAVWHTLSSCVRNQRTNVVENPR